MCVDARLFADARDKGKVPLKDIRPIEIFMVSVVQRQGYGEGMSASSSCAWRELTRAILYDRLPLAVAIRQSPRILLSAL